MAVFGAAVAGCATEGSVSSLSERAAERLSGLKPTGEMVSCLNRRAIHQFTPLTDSLILVQAGGGEQWLNRTMGRCIGADGVGSRLQYQATTGQICRGEMLQVFDNNSGIVVGSCSLGDFERLEVNEAQEEPA